MKGELTLKLLEILEDVAYAVSDVAYIFTLPYGSSFGRMQRSLSKRQIARTVSVFENPRVVSKQRFHELVHRLEKDGLIKSKHKGKSRFLSITSKGRSMLEILKKRKVNAFPHTHYPLDGDDVLKIIIFDIPEKEKRKREWLRGALKHLKFAMLQKSVWVGKAKLPKEFLEDLSRLKLLDYVEIFAVSKTGSLKQLTP